MKRKLAVLLLMLLALGGGAALASSGIPSPTDQFYVGDFANQVSVQDEEHIMRVAVELEKKTGAQVVVVTVASMQGQPLEQFSLSLARQWGIGSQKENNGVLILLAMEERESRIEVGRGLEGALPDGKTGRIQDEQMLPYYLKGEYSAGLRAGFDAVVAQVCEEYGVMIEGIAYTEPEEESDGPGTLFVPIIFIILILLISRKNPWIWLLLGGRGGRGGFGGFGGGGRGGFGGFSGGGGGFSGGGSSRKF